MIQRNVFIDFDVKNNTVCQIDKHKHDIKNNCRILYSVNRMENQALFRSVHIIDDIEFAVNRKKRCLPLIQKTQRSL